MQEAFNWIAKIIEGQEFTGCTYDFHFRCAEKLIELFFEKYKDEVKKLELLELMHEAKVKAEVY
jgi:hypothetical protein